MSYERLTDKKREQEIRGIFPFLRRDEEKIYLHLAELEDKIENGLLVERYFIKDDITPYGKVFHNVCEYDPSAYIIIQQCDTISEAKEKLRELRGEK